MNLGLQADCTVLGGCGGLGKRLRSLFSGGSEGLVADIASRSGAAAPLSEFKRKSAPVCDAGPGRSFRDRKDGARL